MNTPLERLISRPWFWVVLVGAIATFPIVKAMRTPLPPKLPVLGAFPDFQLTDEQGQPFGSDLLRGRAWIADFFAVGCADDCQRLVGKFGQVQHRTRNLGPAFHRVSFSVASDAPALLADYAKAHRASPRMWSFVSGAPAGFVDAHPQVADGHFAVLVDAQMHIRAFYDMAAPDVVDALLFDVGMLLNRPE